MEKEIVLALRNSCVKVEAIVETCARIDRNKDGAIHLNQFLDVLHDRLGTKGLSPRQIRYITNSLACRPDGSLIRYEELLHLLDIRAVVEEEEHWSMDNYRDNVSQYQKELRAPSSFSQGSVGRWVEEAACPAEIR